MCSLKVHLVYFADTRDLFGSYMDLSLRFSILNLTRSLSIFVYNEAGGYRVALVCGDELHKNRSGVRLLRLSPWMLS